MRIVGIADLHGYLPDNIPDCDLLLIGGDICPEDNQEDWLNKKFMPWVDKIPAAYVVAIAGNHDFILEKYRPLEICDNIPDGFIYLQDEQIKVCGLKIYGLPWVHMLKNWAFYGGSQDIADKYVNQIPKDIDILLCHGPPYSNLGIDRGRDGPAGSSKVAHLIKNRNFKAVVCGHMHEGYGYYRHPNVRWGMFNVSIMNNRYEPINNPVIIYES